MRTWVYNPHTGGKSIPFAVKMRTERRILDYAAKHHVGKFSRIDVRFRGALCYIDVYTEPDLPRGFALLPGETREQRIEQLRNTPIHLCRIRYFGNEDSWSFAWYRYAHEKYEPSFLITGEDHGTPEEAFDVSPLLLRNSRKTECGAIGSLSGMVVRAAPFALLKNCRMLPIR